MIDQRLNIPTLEADFEALVDSLRKTGTITGLSNDGELTTIATINDLKAFEVVSIDGVSYRIVSATSNEFVVKGVISTGTEWKANAPYYMDGHILEIQARLKELDESTSLLKWQKYPLIILLQDIDYSKNKIARTSVSVDILIVNITEGTYITEQRRVNNFEPVLDPLYNKFIAAVNDSNNFFINGNWNLTRRYYWGSELANKNPVSDFLDAIEINDLKLELAIPKCI